MFSRLLNAKGEVNGEFQGRTPEEAMAKARKQRPNESDIRCFRVRRGGFYGFFAKECYIASIGNRVISERQSVNVCIEENVLSDRGKSFGSLEQDLVGFEMDFSSLLESAKGKGSGVTLEQLVESTEDQVHCGNVEEFEKGFPDLLAEAEAVVSGNRKRPTLTTDHYIQATDHDIQDDTRESISAHAPIVDYVAVRGEARHDLNAPVNLAEHLGGLGIPCAIADSGQASSLDSLFAELCNMPKPKVPDLEKQGVILVLNASKKTLQAKTLIAKMIGVEPQDILEASLSELDCLCATVKAKQGKRVAFMANVPCAGNPDEKIAAWINDMNADYVLGVVSATAKRADIAHWLAWLQIIDALSVVNIRMTATPGELLGIAPIAFIDGEKASPCEWMVTFLKAITRERGW